MIQGDLSKGEEGISSRDQVQRRKVQEGEEETSNQKSKDRFLGSRSEVPVNRSSISEVPADKFSADLRYQRADLANMRHQQTDLVDLRYQRTNLADLRYQRTDLMQS
jgi:hypothetical protein